MARGPFHFKSFSVEQDGAAMKVGTDGIVLGSWTPISGARKVVDAGAGNGYVGIMLLQRMEEGSQLVGVELEPGAALQLEENYGNQPFPMQCTAWQGDIAQVAEGLPEWRGSVDLIVSNPPFFRNKPKSPIPARNLARHDDAMPMASLVKAAQAMLRPGGRLCTIWPMDREEEWRRWAGGSGFTISRTTHVRTMAHLPPKRFLTEWTKDGGEAAEVRSELTLEGKATLDYTEEYLSIVRPYLRGT